MKGLIKILVILTLLLGPSLYTNAQTASSSASASVTIISPAIISMPENILFENLEIADDFYQEIFPSSGGDNLKPLLIPQVIIFESLQKGIINLEGSSSNYFDIISSPIINLIQSNGNESILAQTFIKKINSTKAILTGEIQISVDAKIYLVNNQASGNYHAKDFLITINFN